MNATQTPETTADTVLDDLQIEDLFPAGAEEFQATTCICWSEVPLAA